MRTTWILAALVITGCTSHSHSEGDDDDSLSPDAAPGATADGSAATVPSNVSYATQIMPIFDARGCVACHSGNGPGKDLGGLFSNNDALADKLLVASKASGDALWRMPLPPQYESNIDSAVADMKNVGPRYGGSITAALFIQRFVKDTPWAHLDIASTTWKPGSTVPTIPSGATGFGVRLLDRLVADSYEE